MWYNDQDFFILEGLMSEKTVSVQVGPGLGGLLFLTFLILKLTGYINWSWWWVTAPLWGGFALVLGILVLGMIGAVLVALLDNKGKS